MAKVSHQPKVGISSICQFRNHECNQSNFQVITCPLDLAKLRLQTQVRLKPGRATAAWSSSRPLHHDFRQLARFFLKTDGKDTLLLILVDNASLILCMCSLLRRLCWSNACVHLLDVMLCMKIGQSKLLLGLPRLCNSRRAFVWIAWCYVLCLLAVDKQMDSGLCSVLIVIKTWRMPEVWKQLRAP